MQKRNFIPVILSGGSGSRLWPLSRALRPKQFLGLTDERTLFQLTLERLKGLALPLEPIVVANDDHRFLVAEQCKESGVSPLSLILEPVARNTAPAIAVAAMTARDQQVKGHDPVLLVLPSDHIVQNRAAFERAIAAGLSAAESGAMVTFGIVPTSAETGYGYVKAAGPSEATSTEKAAAYSVEAFVEKPNQETAERYLKEGGYFWNSGMFMFRASTYLEELARCSPLILRACEESLKTAKNDLDFVRLDKTAFSQSPSDSIDYAVMEKTKKAVLVPMDAGWSDVGAWSSVWKVQPQDLSGNASRGDVMLESSTNCYVHAEDRKSVV